jgi:hypothetical protein
LFVVAAKSQSFTEGKDGSEGQFPPVGQARYWYSGWFGKNITARRILSSTQVGAFEMALTVEKLNNDTTFFLAFAPSFAPKKTARKFPGAFTILIDPWLNGYSSILHPTFQISKHTTQCAVKSLAELKENPDLIIISQDKPDHCHKATLCSLPQDANTKILATPAAAKKIRAWKHFDPSMIHEMKPYNASKPETVVKISIAAYTSTSSPGEITIANIPSKLDVTNVHNAIGITYRPPGSLLTAVEGDSVNLSDMFRPDKTRKIHKARSAMQLTDVKPFVPGSGRPRTSSSSRSPVYQDASGRIHDLPAPPPVPGHKRTDSKMGNPKTVQPISLTHKEKALSVIYTPHGISLSTLKPYITKHLRPTTCAHLRDEQPAEPQPVTVMFHSLNQEENPWIMGGMVANGAPGGTALAGVLRPRYWISAHDEVKDNRGFATTWIRSRAFRVEDVQGMVGEYCGKAGGGGGMRTQVKCLGVGERMRVDG